MSPKRMRVQGRVLRHIERAIELLEGGGSMTDVEAEVRGAYGAILVSWGNSTIMKGAPMEGCSVEEIGKRLEGGVSDGDGSGVFGG